VTPEQADIVRKALARHLKNGTTYPYAAVAALHEADIEPRQGARWPEIKRPTGQGLFDAKTEAEQDAARSAIAKVEP